MKYTDALSLYYRSIRCGEPETAAAVLDGEHGDAVRDALADAGRGASVSDKQRASRAGTQARWGMVTLAMQAKEHNIDPRIVRQRVLRGWSVAKALETPVTVRQRQETLCTCCHGTNIGSGVACPKCGEGLE